MDAVFDGGVDFLEWLAPIFGMSYKEINVWLRVMVMPGITLMHSISFMYLWRVQDFPDWARLISRDCAHGE